MPDVHDSATRSRNMSAIKGSDTKPEVTVRKGLHRRGLRYNLHAKRLPGRPDLVFPKYRAIVFVHGCFWHSHDCHLFKMPSTRPDFWAKKLARNKQLDLEVLSALHQQSWRTLIIWECALKGRSKLGEEALLDSASEWIRGDNPECEIAGSSA